MSYILEALKRAERERAQGQNPVTGDASSPRPPDRGRNTLLKIIIAALVVNALVIAVLVLRHRPDASKPESKVAAGKPALRPTRGASESTSEERAWTSQPSPKAAPVTAPAPPPPSAPAQEEPAVQQGVASMDDLGASDSDDADREGSTKIAQTPAVAAVEHHGSVTYAKKPLTPDVPPPAQESDDATADAGTETSEALENPPPPDEPAEAAPEPSEQIASAKPIAPRAAPPAAASAMPTPAASAPGKVKPLSEMSAAYQGSFPQLMLQVHVYDPSPQKRFAIIDGTRYREGDALPQGARLERIVADGLVIAFRNERVLYPLGRH
ncbi:MAG TPA: general secretion pathway protein GspB [Nevskiaceae bacterium]|nr:general secretion pathway protein GspB [Nevskiaceae bacterium]